ncbi:hypothetical protein pdam_00014012 [Pocillopora damicornis]|uniref:ETS domain-containing protein n=1 Tax=Pocillopora damicornis TaxID=46731 RepID=A0A3M6V0D3_POCDA|nr:hypothetical protein pdam_00014012 [Pocillopora damicornis]
MRTLSKFTELTYSAGNREETERNNPEKEQKQTRYKNTIHLWEFLLELLEDERYIPLISWTKKEDGEFKIKRQEEVAKRWGRLKQRAGMNYDKLSRALRSPVCEKIGIESETSRKPEIVEEVNSYFSTSTGTIP